MVVGRADKLQFDIWLSEHERALGRGLLLARVGNSLIWRDQDNRGVSWTWIELLEQLARSWPFLKYEETAPLGAYDRNLSLLRTGHLESPDSDFEPGPSPESTRETFFFLRRHNLATGIEGLYLPSLTILREGRKAWVASESVARQLDFAETLQTLSQLGDLLADHIGSSEQERSRLAATAWRNREPAAEATLLIKLGSDRLAEELVPPNQTIASYLEAQNDAEYESSLLVAARMSGTLPLESRRRIIEQVRQVPAKPLSDLLRDVSAQADSVVPYYLQWSFKQGQTLAQWARKRFGFAPEVRADPHEVLQSLGVEVSLHRFGTELIDAVGCWGHLHGPAVLVNRDGKHAQSAVGRRATLAHELCHVLVDREGSLPAAEVFGGNVPRPPESRANAFAAEFLLPQSNLERIRKATDARKAIDQLRDKFEVSRELIAWQIINHVPTYASLGDSEKVLLRRWTAEAHFAWRSQ